MKRVDNRLIIIGITLIVMALLLKSFEYHPYSIHNMSYEVPNTVEYGIDAKIDETAIEIYLDDIKEQKKDIEKFSFGTIYHINNIRRDLNNNYDDFYVYENEKGNYGRWLSLLMYEDEIVAYVIFDENYNVHDYNYVQEIEPELYKAIEESAIEDLTLITMRNQYFLVVDYERMYKLPFNLSKKL